MSLSLTAPEFEKLFDAFVRTRTGGLRFSEFAPNSISDGTETADYIFSSDQIIVELKSLTKNHGDRDSVVRHVADGLNKFGLPKQRIDDWLLGRQDLPRKVIRFANQRVQNSIKHAVRKANSQIKSTQKLVATPHDGILIVANLQELLFGPIELLRYFAGHALERSVLAIDAIVLITPSVTYSSSGNLSQHYLVPVYREGKQKLGDFIEPLLASWIEFEAASLGVKAEVEICHDIDERDKNARPTLIR